MEMCARRDGRRTRPWMCILMMRGGDIPPEDVLGRGAGWRCFGSGTSDAEGEHALSHEVPSAVLMQLLSWLSAACLRSISEPQATSSCAQRAQKYSFCTSACVTDMGKGGGGGGGGGMR